MSVVGHDDVRRERHRMQLVRHRLRSLWNSCNGDWTVEQQPARSIAGPQWPDRSAVFFGRLEQAGWIDTGTVEPVSVARVLRRQQRTDRVDSWPRRVDATARILGPFQHADRIDSEP